MSEASALAPKPAGKSMPGNLFMPLPVKDVDRGKMMQNLQAAFEKAVSQLINQKEAGDTRGKASVALKIGISHTPDADGHMDISYAIETKLPSKQHRSFYRAAPCGKLITDATPSAVRARQDEEQVPLFDFMGAPRGVVNPATLTLIDDADVVGTIGASA